MGHRVRLVNDRGGELLSNVRAKDRDDYIVGRDGTVTII